MEQTKIPRHRGKERTYEDIGKAPAQAEKAAGGKKTDAARTPGEKLRTKKASAEAEGAKLRFGRKEVSPEEKPTAAMKQKRIRKGALYAASAKARQKASKDADDNAGVQAANETTGAADSAAQVMESVRYSHKRKAYRQAVKRKAGAERAKIDVLNRKQTAENPAAASNPLSRWRQKQAVKKEYAARKAGRPSAGTAAASSLWDSGGFARTGTTLKTARRNAAQRTVSFVRQHAHLFMAFGVLALLVLLICGMVSSCAMAFDSTGNAILATSYTAEEEDIRGAEADYCALEEGLRTYLQNIEDEFPEYDEYEVDVSEIGHDPYELAAFLTVLYEDYSRAEVQETLRDIYNRQYEYALSERTETRTETRRVHAGESLGTVVTSGYCNCALCSGEWAGGPTASGVYPTADHTIAVDVSNPFVPLGTKVIMNGVEYTVEDIGNFDRYGVQFDVYYDSHWEATLHGHQTWEAYLADNNGLVIEQTQTVTKHILTVKVTNHSLESVLESWGLTDYQMERYRLLVEGKGNREEIFAETMYLMTQSAAHQVPGYALTNERFARMIQEAEKYLGYPYVWGGSSPSTGFDCSGFVCWVINHCGNGWDVGRTTAEGLRQMLPSVSPEDAQPGDLILFQGTYPTSGASHVGIYAGDGMMIHAGNPIKYASVNSSYFRKHFLCYLRLP